MCYNTNDMQTVSSVMKQKYLNTNFRQEPTFFGSYIVTATQFGQYDSHKCWHMHVREQVTYKD